MNRSCIVLIFLILSVSSVYSQESSKTSQLSLTYIPIQNYSSIPTINVSDMADFSKLITDNVVKHIFYTNTTFFFQAPQMAYPFSIGSNGYKSIADYTNGKQRNFKDGASFYYSVDNQLNTQEEVDYFKQETFFSTPDYREAQKQGFVKNNNSNRISRISGIIKKTDLEKNIRYANAIIYLLYYQQTDLVKSFLDNKEVEKLLLPFSTRRDSNIIVEFKKDFYYINLDISNLQYTNKDSVFFYTCKFSQYLDQNDFQTNYNNRSSYTIKGSETIATKDLKHPDYATFLNELNTLLGERQNVRYR